MEVMAGELSVYGTAAPSLAAGERAIELVHQEALSAAHPSVTGWRAGTRRVVELAAVSAALLFLMPLLVALFLAVKLQDGGPALFGHWRIGQGGRRFRCWKFRTMVVDAEQKLQAYLAADPQAQAEWAADQKLRSDPRITWIGRFLRKSSLDELPQLLNVLTGEMSLIGPRPIVGAEVAKYGRWFADYIQVRPGVTGLWQVSGRNRTTYRRRVALDATYVRRWSLALDVKILLRTVWVVISRDGAF